MAFVRRMIEESVAFADRVRWFTTLVSSAASLPPLQRTLKLVTARYVRVIPMAQGQKHSRILAWTFRIPPVETEDYRRLLTLQKIKAATPSATSGATTRKSRLTPGNGTRQDEQSKKVRSRTSRQERQRKR